MKYLIFLFIFFASDEVLACQCREQSFEAQIENADFIYLGKITHSSLVSDIDVSSQLEIIEILKGKPDNLKLDSFAENHMCSVYAVTGLTYVVFGKHGETPRLNYCSPSKLLMKELTAEFELKLKNLRDATNK